MRRQYHLSTTAKSEPPGGAGSLVRLAGVGNLARMRSLGPAASHARDEDDRTATCELGGRRAALDPPSTPELADAPESALTVTVTVAAGRAGAADVSPPPFGRGPDAS